MSRIRFALPVLLAACAAVAAADPPLPAPVAAEFLSVPGGRVYYEVFGAGYPLVLIHDGLAHSAVWDAQVAAFAPHYRVIRYDRRGYGRSDAPTAPYSNVEDLRALLQALAVERAVLVGSSAGGGLVIDYTLAHPEQVEALILSGPVVNGLGYSYHFLRRAYANFGADMAATIEKWVNDPYFVAPGNDAARARLRELLIACPQNFDPASGRYTTEPAAPALAHLGEITVPALLLVGDRDIPDVHAHVGAIEAGIRGARRVVIPNAGHLSYLEQPQAFDHEVEDFLSLLTLAPGGSNFTRGFAPVAGSALYYEAMGAGDPVVLIHGGALDHRMWDAQFAALAEHHRVIRYDVRGDGLTRSPYGEYRNYEAAGSSSIRLRSAGWARSARRFWRSWARTTCPASGRSSSASARRCPARGWSASRALHTW
jgi:3-oxoadipate enol-lactonase